MRSKLVRYIFLKINHLAELTPTLFKYIPTINFKNKTNLNDEYVYAQLKLNKDEQAHINEIVTKVPAKSRTATAKKASKGGAFNKTRRASR